MILINENFNHFDIATPKKSHIQNNTHENNDPLGKNNNNKILNIIEKPKTTDITKIIKSNNEKNDILHCKDINKNITIKRYENTANNNNREEISNSKSDISIFSDYEKNIHIINLKIKAIINII